MVRIERQIEFIYNFLIRFNNFSKCNTTFDKYTLLTGLIIYLLSYTM